MNKFYVLLFVVFLIPCVSASMSINIDIGENDVVREDFTVYFNADSDYDNFEFLTVTEPLSVVFDGEYDISQTEKGYSILFYQNIHPGENMLNFSILYDEMVENAGNVKVIRTSFGSVGGVNVSIKLPEGFFLSGEPSTTPEPDRILSDGQRILIEWSFDEEGSIVVFYETNRANYSVFIGFALLLVVLAVIFFVLNRKRTTRKIDDLLSEDEKAILSEIKEGVSKQKDIARNLNFSKSKMSKVVRKLEEKNLIERTPHFKTNKLKIKK